jgi:pimeloyl-ACP methyl ester carboxylesterase
MVTTTRLQQHVYESGTAGHPPLILIHGNASSARFFEQLLPRLAGYHVLAPDLRGYGATEAQVVDATRGVRDFSDDIEALAVALRLERFHLLGWSLGGCVAMQYTIDHPQRVLSLTLEATGSPFGYGCTRNAAGALNWDDVAGSGAGLINPEIIARYQAGDTTTDSPFSPRSVMRQLYVKPPFAFEPTWEDALVEQMLLMRIGDQFYPGDSVTSPNWPFTGPGIYGANNALSPKYCHLTGLADITPRPPMLWVHGADDQVVGDMALVDPGALGKMGAIPGWPGDEVYPPQPMLAQIRALLDRYRANGGTYEEVVLPNCAHAPHIEHPTEFVARFTALMQRATPKRRGFLGLFRRSR